MREHSRDSNSLLEPQPHSQILLRVGAQQGVHSALENAFPVLPSINHDAELGRSAVGWLGLYMKCHLTSDEATDVHQLLNTPT